MDPLHMEVLQVEVSTLMAKGVVREVEPGDQRAGFYSRYFHTPKRDLRLRPILDLRGLNWFVWTLNFKMLTIPRVRQADQPGDWFATIDLREAFAPLAIAKLLTSCGCRHLHAF